MFVLIKKYLPHWLSVYTVRTEEADQSFRSLFGIFSDIARDLFTNFSAAICSVFQKFGRTDATSCFEKSQFHKFSFSISMEIEIATSEGMFTISKAEIVVY